MAEFQKNRKWQKIAYSKLTLFTLFVFLVLLSVSLVKIAGKSRETAQNNQTVLRELEKFQSQSAALSGEIGKLKTPDGIEEKIREKYRVVKDGEGLIVIIDDKGNALSEEPSKQGGFWGFL